MLNPFPQLLSLSFFAPTLLRVAMAAVSFYVVYATWRNSKDTPTMTWLSIAANVAVGAMLLVGFYTQIAALIALLFRIASFFLPKKYQGLVLLPVGVRLLAIIILLSLLVTGAGAFAMDLPL